MRLCRFLDGRDARAGFFFDDTVIPLDAAARLHRGLDFVRLVRNGLRLQSRHPLLERRAFSLHPVQLADPRTHGTQLVKDRANDGKVSATMLADDGLVLDFLGAERTIHRQFPQAQMAETVAQA